MKRTRELNPEKRVAIIAAAIHEFDISGYDGCSMDVIAKEANVSKATVYKHFNNKINLFTVIMLQLKEVMDTYHHIEYDPKQTLESQLIQFATQELIMVCDPKYAVLFRIGMLALMQKTLDLALLKREIVDNIFLNLVSWFEEAKADRRLDFDDATFVTTQFIGNIKVFSFYPQLIGEKPINKKMQKKVAQNAVTSILCQYAIT